MSEASSETSLWRFSLHFYRQPGVAAACIALQDECGVDVNLLLFLLWLGASGRLLSAEAIKELDEAVRPWRDLTVIPIREVRRGLKGVRTLVDAGKQEALRTKIKAIELEAERLQQEALDELGCSAPLGSEAPFEEATRANLAAYERMLGTRFPTAAVDQILDTFESMKFYNYEAR